MTNRSTKPRRLLLLRWAGHVGRVLLVAAGLLSTVLVALVAWEAAAYAQAPTEPGVPDIATVINNMRLWLVGILFVAATLYLTIAGFRYLWSNGDPSEIEKAKTALRNAAIGYALAILAPLVVTIVTGFVA